MVPQDTVLVRSSSPHRHLLRAGADVGCYPLTLVLPAGGLSHILAVQVGHEHWPTADFTRRGHSNVMSWPIPSIILPMGDALVDSVNMLVVLRRHCLVELKHHVTDWF